MTDWIRLHRRYADGIIIINVAAVAYFEDYAVHLRNSETIHVAETVEEIRRLIGESAGVI